MLAYGLKITLRTQKEETVEQPKKYGTMEDAEVLQKVVEDAAVLVKRVNLLAALTQVSANS